MFYNANIDTPLSVYLDSPAYASSPLAQLKAGSNLEDLRYHPHWSQFHNAAFAWCVVGAEYSQEDSTMTQFRAYGMHGEHLPFATFGVNHGGVGQISLAGFRYPPWKNNQYYVPRDNQIHTRRYRRVLGRGVGYSVSIRGNEVWAGFILPWTPLSSHLVSANAI